MDRAQAAVSPLFTKLMGSRGQAMLRYSTDALKNLWLRHSNKLIVAGAVGVGAAVYVSNNLSSKPSQQQPEEPVRTPSLPWTPPTPCKIYLFFPVSLFFSVFLSF
jgi:hypothetical protein